MAGVLAKSVTVLGFSVRPTFPGLHGFNWVIVLLFVLAALYFARLYKIDAKRLTGRQKTILWTLRTVVTVIVLIMLLRPSVQLVTQEERLPVAVVLLDESTSMNYPEAQDHALLQGKSKAERSRFHAAVEALDQLQQDLSLTHRVKVFAFSDTLQQVRDIPYRKNQRQPPVGREELLQSLKVPAGDYTEAGDAITGVLEKLVGEKVSSVVLLSDGRNTGGENLGVAAERAAQANVRVQAVTFGSEDPLRDLRIDRVDAPAEASLGDLLPLHIQITNYITSRLKVNIRLFENDQLDQEKEIVLAKGENHVTLTTIPRVEGLREYKLVLPEFEDEMDYGNNQSVFHVKVIKRTLRVLFVVGKPTREYQHATLCMLRDPVIRISCFLQSAHVDYTQQGNVVIDRLPKTVAEWQEYDVIILYDIDPKEISSQQVSGAENTVSKGAGLLVIAGRNYGLGPLIQIHANKMRQLLPVEIDKNRPLQYEKVFDKPLKVERTPEARGSNVFRFVANERLNEEIWSSFPELYWYHPLISVKPKAVATLRKTQGPQALQDYGDCVMAIHRFGEGLAVYLGTDEIWRWRYPYGTYDYDLFWNHLVRYLGETRLLGAQKQVALSTDKRAYAPGERVRIKLQLLDHALLQQLEGEHVAVTVIDSNRSKQVVPLERDRGGQPAYHGVFPSRRIGPHVIEAKHTLSTADTEAKSLYDVKEGFKVELLPLESLDTRADLENMRKLAEKSGGMYLDHHTMSKESLAEVARSVPTDKLLIAHEVIREVWDTWVALLFIVALAATEWSLRKYWGLL